MRWNDAWLLRMCNDWQGCITATLCAQRSLATAAEAANAPAWRAPHHLDGNDSFSITYDCLLAVARCRLKGSVARGCCALAVVAIVSAPCEHAR